jgi:hypothetical protein
MLSCSVGNSKSQLYKAKGRIRELLARKPETRLAHRNGQARTNEHAKPERKSWGLTIGQDLALPPPALSPN